LRARKTMRGVPKLVARVRTRAHGELGQISPTRVGARIYPGQKSLIFGLNIQARSGRREKLWGPCPETYYGWLGKRGVYPMTPRTTETETETA